MHHDQSAGAAHNAILPTWSLSRSDIIRTSLDGPEADTPLYDDLVYLAEMSVGTPDVATIEDVVNALACFCDRDLIHDVLFDMQTYVPSTTGKSPMMPVHAYSHEAIDALVNAAKPDESAWGKFLDEDRPREIKAALAARLAERWTPATIEEATAHAAAVVERWTEIENQRRECEAWAANPENIAAMKKSEEEWAADPENVARMKQFREDQKAVAVFAPHVRAKTIGEKLHRLRTGIATLDKATMPRVDGDAVGLPCKKFVVVGGAPGAGKTALCVQLAHRWLSEGVHVAFYAADEDADAILTRFGQLEGIDRAALESGDAKARNALAAWCARVNLLLVDADETGSDVADVSALLRRHAYPPDVPSVLIVDSIQTARITGAGKKDIRERTDATVAVLKACAKSDGHLVIATSELARGAYRSKDSKESINALAAFKESGGIEYGVSMALVLTTPENGTVDVEIPKNRLGPCRDPFRLRLDWRTAGVSETQGPAPVQDIGDDERKQRVRLALEQVFPKALSKTEIAARVPGRKADVLACVDLLADAGDIDRVGTKYTAKDDKGHMRRACATLTKYRALKARELKKLAQLTGEQFSQLVADRFIVEQAGGTWVLDPDAVKRFAAECAR